jgi:CheY-like chemotaxis protein
MDDNIFVGKRILIVEDDAASFEYLAAVLECTGAQIIHVDNGMDAIQICMNINPDVVLMDIRLPKMNGYDAIEQIIALQPNKCIIAVTANAFPEDRQKCLKVGCNAYLTKPIDSETLMNTLKNYLKII